MFDHVNYKEVVENVGVRSFCRMKKRCKNQIKIPLNFARKTLLVFFVIVKKLFYLQNSLKECPFPEGQPQLLFPYDIKKKKQHTSFLLFLRSSSLESYISSFTSTDLKFALISLKTIEDGGYFLRRWFYTQVYENVIHSLLPTAIEKTRVMVNY